MIIEWRAFKFTNFITVFNITLFTRLLIIFNLIEFLLALGLTGNSYDQSIAYKLLPTSEKRELQTHLLNLLGLDHRPKPKRKEIFSSIYLKEIYQSFLNEDTLNLIYKDGHPFYHRVQFDSHPTVKAFNESDVIVSFMNDNLAKINGLDSNLSKGSRFWFNTREIAQGSKVSSAELRLFKNETHPEILDLFEINIYFIDNERNKKLRLIESKTFSNVRGWLIFNVTGAIQTWIDNPNSNSGLYMTIYSTSTGKELSPESIGLNGSMENNENLPFVFAFFKSHSHLLHRKKRDVKNNEEVSTYKPHNPYYELTEFVSNRSCQKKSLFVSFKELGWQDWIIAPEGYAASFCDGECSFPLTAQTNATNHAIVQTLVHLMKPSSVPKASCAPTKLSSIMVLYFDDNSNVILKKYRNMVVKSCGCH
ncbi:bone morphogenetic protein 5-like [Panonychus citri]|uniref:bone morphogenetic protein 5-like n=1 Tax=Panonychus citri TaxID=50023 RepID=UPI002307E663|nr:bone morphogenetic protein 5-like [Panonychus citri]